MLCDEWEMERDSPDVDNCLPGKCMMAHEDRSGSPTHRGRCALGLASVKLPGGFNQDPMSGKMRIISKRSLIVVLIVLTGSAHVIISMGHVWSIHFLHPVFGCSTCSWR